MLDISIVRRETHSCGKNGERNFNHTLSLLTVLSLRLFALVSFVRVGTCTSIIMAISCSNSRLICVNY